MIHRAGALALVALTFGLSCESDDPECTSDDDCRFPGEVCRFESCTPGGFYANCVDNDRACGPVQARCLLNGTTPDCYGVCTQPCATDDDCWWEPPAPEHPAACVFVNDLQAGYCVVPCPDGACPDGMICREEICAFESPQCGPSVNPVEPS